MWSFPGAPGKKGAGKSWYQADGSKGVRENHYVMHGYNQSLSVSVTDSWRFCFFKV
jgi:hypothetical protein